MGNWKRPYHKEKNRIMRKIVSLIIMLTFLTSGYSLFAQEKSFNLIKIGVKGFGGITDTCYLNSIVNEWIYMVVDVSNAELQGEPITLPFNIEYGYQPFIIIHPIKFLQIGVKMDFVYSNILSKFENPLLNDNYELQIKMKSYMPSVFTYLTLGKFELGGGIIQSFTSIQVKDNFFGYNDKWYGNNTGYELSLGFSTSQKKRFGFTMSIKYRGLFINEFNDNLNRKVIFSNNHENLSIDMSGFSLEMGLYFQFIKLKKQENEN